MAFWQQKRGQPSPADTAPRMPPYAGFPPAPPRNIFAIRPTPQPGAQAAAFQSWLYALGGTEQFGAGVLPRYHFDMFSAPGRYLKGAVVYGIQQINFGRQPEPGGPLWTPGQLAAILGRYDLLAAMTPVEAAGALPSQLNDTLAHQQRFGMRAAAAGTGWHYPGL